MRAVHSQTVPGFPPPWKHGDTTQDDEKDPMAQRQREKMEKARNEQRQQQIVKDTDKLLALATELKAEVDKSSKDTLSVSVVKKAEEIEKLAKMVKEKMRQ